MVEIVLGIWVMTTTFFVWHVVYDYKRNREKNEHNVNK